VKLPEAGSGVVEIGMRGRAARAERRSRGRQTRGEGRQHDTIQTHAGHANNELLARSVHFLNGRSAAIADSEKAEGA
jgi:hypothetical protein